MTEKEEDYLDEVPDEVEGPELVIATESYTKKNNGSESDD